MPHERGMTLQDAATANGNGETLNFSGLRHLALQITGTFNASIVFEATMLNGTNWIAVRATTLLNDNRASEIADTTHLWIFDMPGVRLFRSRIKSYVSGAVTVTVTGTSL